LKLTCALRSVERKERQTVCAGPTRDLRAVAADLLDMPLDGEDRIARTHHRDGLARCGRDTHLHVLAVQIGGELHRDGVIMGRLLDIHCDGPFWRGVAQAASRTGSARVRSRAWPRLSRDFMVPIAMPDCWAASA